MRIANPIYDSVFKYLLEDNALARLILSTILQEEIIELDLDPQEYLVSGVTPLSLTVYRLDFSAKVKNAQGEFRKVLIEIQKAKLDSDLMRFRRYLGNQYRNANNIQKVSTDIQEEKDIPLPILTIYFLGHSLEYSQAPVIRVQRECLDVATKEKIEKKETFIESLTHDSYIIQIPHLPHHRRTDLEEMLQVFDQTKIYVDHHGNMDKHQLEINENDIPERYRPILRRLQYAIADPKMFESMEVEDEIVEELQKMERKMEHLEQKLNQERTEKEKTEKLLTNEREEKERLLRILQQLGIEPPE